MPSPGPAGSAARPASLTERHVLALGLGVSGAFVVAAALAAGATLLTDGGSWASIHLALAGAATVAIGTFMPHFAVTLAGTRPAPPMQRLLGIALLALGAAFVVAGYTVVGVTWSAVGAVTQLAGIAVVAWHTVAPSRDPLARRHPVVLIAYLAALAEFGAGIILGGLAAAGVPAVLAGWATLRASHAWVTLFGAVSLTIFATLVYLAPTVLGARIRASAGLFIGFVGMLAGPPIAALGFALELRWLVVGAMALTFAGAVGQVAFVADASRRRGRFTSEHDWRRVAIGHLIGGTGWFAAAVAVAGVQLLGGRAIGGWAVGLLALPMVAGWMLQELVGSWTHLLPAGTPGDAARHARQRRMLAVLSRTRLVAWNVAVALAWAGLAFGLMPLAVAGLALLGGSVALAVATMGRALVVR